MSDEDYVKYVPEAVRKSLEAVLMDKETGRPDWAKLEIACTPYLIGREMKLSNLREGCIARMPDCKEYFIVSNRWPEDRVSGCTEITYNGGHHTTHSWDHSDPVVVFLGRGRLKVFIEMEQGEAVRGATRKTFEEALAECRKWQMTDAEAEELMK